LGNQGAHSSEESRVRPGVLVGDGLTILQTDTFEEAPVFVENEGFRAFDLRRWELREGQISVTRNASKSNFQSE
jgi:hypothetical protein